LAFLYTCIEFSIFINPLSGTGFFISFLIALVLSRFLKIKKPLRYRRATPVALKT